ncbi:hypothetical protein B1400_1183 [Bifidobacterium italicum]|uniref:Gram-positive cocci surface proteins LPxTG domain-containing protein n=1 Tax=Bifidobacterium italicum TaxID=1960968 RepID=A0A2A2EJB9_9BIFI|nr:isopeptide-forming domain-containing fimbrial protein [Bifidobacterium italicum]PAU69121.1 hypothetical protein B1400_1183 [Bifidobacterium italicum]
MKKVWKGFAAAVSAAAIAATGFIGATSASADPVGTGNITLNGTVADDQYEGYRLLNVTGISGTSVAYEVNDKYAAVLKTALGLTGDVTDKQIVDGIKALSTNDTTTNSDSHNVRAFAAEVMTAINAVNNDADDTNNIGPDLTETARGTSLAFTDIPRGYYLFNQTVNGDPDANTDSSFIVDTALDTDTNIAVKNGTVTLVKKVQDNDTSNGQTANQWIDGADYNIGDDVPFQLTGTLPKNLTSFDTFNYVFHDSLSAGLTRNNDLKVYAVNVNETTTTKQDITGSFDVKTTTAQDLTSDPKVGETFTVSVKNTGTEADPVYNLMAITTDADGAAVSITKDTKIVVEYTAKLNTSAVIGSTGNPNTAKLEFSNNSNHDGTGDTEFTPDDKVTVFTYKVDVEKTFDVGAPADNDLPKFTLYKKNASGTYVEYTNDKEPNAEKTVVKGADGKYTIGWEGIDAGEYKLVETHIPAGYNQAADVVFTVTADHDIDSEDPKLNSLGGGDAFTGTVSTGSVATTIENKSGNELPSTGGMGTTVLYVAGAAIVLIAGIGLAVALRRRQA